MDSDGDLQYDDDSDGMMFENDSGNESSGDEVDFDEHRPGPSTAHEVELAAEDAPFQVLSVQEIVEFMVVEINEVNEVARVSDGVVKGRGGASWWTLWYSTASCGGLHRRSLRM